MSTVNDRRGGRRPDSLQDLTHDIDQYPVPSSSTVTPRRSESSDSTTFMSPTNSATSSRLSSSSLLARSSSESAASELSIDADGTPMQGGLEWKSSPKSPKSPIRSLSHTVNDHSRSPSSPSSPTSLSRMVPRSPRKERPPRDELAFFVNFLGSPAPDDAVPAEGRTVSRDSVSSSRSENLRRDIENTANRLRIQTANESFTRGILDSGRTRDLAETSLTSGALRESDDSYDAQNSPDRIRIRSPTTSQGGTRPSSPTDTSPLPGRRSTPSVRSVGSRTGLSVRSERVDRDRERGASVESKEWTFNCWLWSLEKEKEKKEKKETGGLLSKNPLSRDRKIKRQSASPAANGAGALFLDSTADPSLIHSVPVGKLPVVVGPSATSKSGHWRSVIGVLKGDGYFRIFVDDKVIQSIFVPSLSRTDVRLVDSSLFGRNQCVFLNSRSTDPSTTSPYARPPGGSPLVGRPIPSAAVRADGSIYLCLPSNAAAQSFVAMISAFASPVFYGQVEPIDRMERQRALNSASDDEEEEGKSRLWRSLAITIIEGRGIGELDDQPLRTPKSSIDRELHPTRSASSPAEPLSRAGSTSSSSNRPVSLSVSSLARGGAIGEASTRDRDVDGNSHLDTFVEIVLNGDVVIRSSVRKSTTSPFFAESFTLTGLPAFTSPLLARVYQVHKGTNSRPTLVGTALVKLDELPRSEAVEEFWRLEPPGFEYQGISKSSVGDLSLKLRVEEQIVLPSPEYQPLFQLLKTDDTSLIATELASEFPQSIDAFADLLLRMYLSDSSLLPRIYTLASASISGDPSSASLLFRGNTFFTRIVETYLRLLGGEYLEASIGDVVRRICGEKIEVEIDPGKFKGGTAREKDLLAGTEVLKRWAVLIWGGIYEARQRCPNDFRLIFGRIQEIVTEKYGPDLKQMKFTSVSAFVFLRFFVPAIIAPHHFGLVSSPPDPRAQRTLVLVAKSIQGLGNFSQFGTKESWMAGMQPFVKENSEGLVDFIRSISTPSATSASSNAYFAAGRLRSSLSPNAREGVPSLPHLIDVSKDLGLLASLVSRLAVIKIRSSIHSSTPTRTTTPVLYTEFISTCQRIDKQATAITLPPAILKISNSLNSLEIDHGLPPPPFTLSTWPTGKPHTPRIPTRPSLYFSASPSTSTKANDPFYIEIPTTPPPPTSSSTRKANRSYRIDGSVETSPSPTEIEEAGFSSPRNFSYPAYLGDRSSSIDVEELGGFGAGGGGGGAGGKAYEFLNRPPPLLPTSPRRRPESSPMSTSSIDSEDTLSIHAVSPSHSPTPASTRRHTHGYSTPPLSPTSLMDKRSSRPSSMMRAISTGAPISIPSSPAGVVVYDSVKDGVEEDEKKGGFFQRMRNRE